MDPNDLGAVREEAQRLLVAGLGAAQAAARGLGILPDARHIATGSAECRLCPICRMIAALRGVDPALGDRVSDAADVVAGVAAVARLLAPPPVRIVERRPPAPAPPPAPVPESREPAVRPEPAVPAVDWLDALRDVAGAVLRAAGESGPPPAAGPPVESAVEDAWRSATRAAHPEAVTAPPTAATAAKESTAAKAAKKTTAAKAAKKTTRAAGTTGGGQRPGERAGGGPAAGDRD